MREAKWIANGLAELAELDGRFCLSGALQQWDEASLAKREALVAELGEICRLHPLVAAESQVQFEALLVRTRTIAHQIRAERNQVARTMQEVETNLKQLGAFRDGMPADAKLLNRLA